MIGTTLGSYAIERELGRGGMGAVYAGRHGLLGRTAAVKVLLPEYSRNQEIVQRFFNEARAATAIKHPGIVEIYDFGFADGVAYIVMELCEGETLAARLRRARILPVDAALAIARQIAGALAAAHKAGIVHRDLKPDNVFLVADAEIASGERIKLLDFGIAKLAPADGSIGVAKTTTGAIIGTPLYMSPEQCRGAGQVDARSDLYALGCMLYEMLCGRVPFLGEGAGDIISAHILLPPAAPRTLAPALAPDVEALILALLAKKPGDRPASAEAVIGELHRLAGSSPPATARTGPGRTEDPSAHADTLVPTQPAAKHAKTTLGGEVTTPRRPARRRAPIWVGIGLAGCAAIAVTVIVTRGGDGNGSGGGTGSGSASGTATPAAMVTIDAAAAVAVVADAAPPDDPDALTIVIGSMGGASVQRAAAATLVKVEPSARVFVDGDPNAIGRPRAFFLDTDDVSVDTQGPTVECKLKLTVATFPERAMFSFLNGSATVAAGKDGAGLDDAKVECVQAVVEDLVTTKVVPTLRARLAAPAAPAPEEPPAALSKDEIHAGIKKYTAAIRACYEHALKANPALAGRVVVAFTVGEAGRVTSAHASGLDADVDACVESVVRTARFPVAGAETTAEYPFDFTSSRDAAPACDPKTLDDARDAAKNGAWARSLQLCEQALACKRSDPEAAMVCALASCNLKDCRRAKKYVSALSPASREMAKQVCLRAGVDPSGC